MCVGVCGCVCFRFSPRAENTLKAESVISHSMCPIGVNYQVHTKQRKEKGKVKAKQEMAREEKVLAT